MRTIFNLGCSFAEENGLLSIEGEGQRNGRGVHQPLVSFPDAVLCCANRANPITAPIGTAPFNLLNTVKVGMT